MLKSDPAWMIVCLARLIRWAMVASGTPNAAAICAVRQAADRAQGQRDLAGRRQCRMAAAEQQGQRVVPVCGPGIAGGPSSSDCGVAAAIRSSRFRRDCSLRAWSIAGAKQP